MEFLARSWSLSAMELSKALPNTPVASSNILEKSPLCSIGNEAHDASSVASKECVKSLLSPRQGLPRFQQGLQEPQPAPSEKYGQNTHLKLLTLQCLPRIRLPFPRNNNGCLQK
ncbi:hypothetical protein CJ030_MR8G001764 [Morella rubra]|uniref:VAN3-binding protein-like auxin canalisation domain-containing protein n=1 Tax=Morella rubra TaxID=262757 RepID=A0A6A1UPF9_9ROSI|nr:hypothetical protein CJ030_MR8G001764 [Morella rubra]